MIRTANIEVSLQRLSILRIEHPQANPLKLACTPRAGATLPSGLTATAEIHTSRNVAAETAPLASTTVSVAADATSFEVIFDSPQTNQTVTPNSVRACWLVLYGVGDADRLYTLAAADLLLGWHAISLVTADPPATSILVEKGGVAWASGRQYVSGTVVTVGTTAYVCTANNTSTADDEPGVGQEWESFWVVLSGGGGGGATNLTTTVSPTQIVIVSDTGTDATIPAADETNAGLMLPAQVTKLAGIQAGAEVNVNADWNAVSGDAAILNKPTITNGTVTTVSVTTANGVSGSVANATTTPAITFTLGAITPTSVNGITLSGSSTPTLTVTGTTAVSGTNTGNVTLATSLSSILTLSGQQLQAVTDLGADRIVFFDQSANAGAGAWDYLVAGTGLNITGTTITATFDPASPGAIGGTTPSTAVFTQLDVRTELDVQSTSGAAGPILIWNTGTDQPTNWERARLQWSSNILTIATEFNGTGTARGVQIQTGGLTRFSIGATGLITVNGAATPANTPLSVKAINSGGNQAVVRVENATSASSIVELGGTPSNNGYINVISSSAGTVDIQAGNSQFPGFVGIGRGTGGSLSSARLHIRGSGTGATETLRVENSSGTARFIVRDDGAFSFGTVSPSAIETGWTTFTNLTPLRTCDVNTVTLQELARIVGTMIQADKAKGLKLA